MTATINQQRPAASDLDRSLSPRVTVTQYSRRAILGIWAAAAIPMGALAWIVAPALADGGRRGVAHPAALGVPHRRADLAVRPRRRPRWLRAAQPALVPAAPGPLAQEAPEPAHGPGRRPDLARCHPPGRGTRTRGAGGPSGTDQPQFRRVPVIERRSGHVRRLVALVRTLHHHGDLQHRAGRGAAVPRRPAAPDAGRLR